MAKGQNWTWVKMQLAATYQRNGDGTGHETAAVLLPGFAIN